MPLELIFDQQDDFVSFFEGENEKEKEESEKEKNEKEKEHREKNEMKEKKANKFLYASKSFEVTMVDIMSRTASLQSPWEPPALTVFSPPPELKLS